MADPIRDDDMDDTVRYWLGQIESAQRAKDCASWYERGAKVIERYLDKQLMPAIDTKSAAHRMNVLWSNVETIKPALYAKTPKPDVQRRYHDKDPVGKWAAICLERSLDYTLDAYDVDYQIRSCVDDYLLPGRGQVWLSYEPTFATGAPRPDEKPIEQLTWEYCKTKHLHWKDFLTNPARTWDEVWWGAQRAYMSRDEVTKRFGKAIANKLSFTESKEEDRNATADANVDRVKKAAIWEVWCKTTGLVYFVSKSCPEPLEKPDKPPLNFEGFFPFPRPLTTTTTTDSIIPTPDFCFYQNQADEIDRLTQRINLLTKALRVSGVYDGTQQALGRLLEDSQDNVMIPCETWAVLAAAGGIKGAVDFFPLADIIAALQQCYVSRDQAKAVMYEVTGISDIVRGASDPNETLGAQQIKTQWGALRIRDRQAEVQRFVRDIMRLKSEIIAEQFQLETIKTMSNCPLLMAAEKQALQQRKMIAAQAQQMAAQNPQAAQQIAQANPQLAQMAQPLTPDEEQKLREPTWEEVYALLKDQRLRSFRIDIETDSTIQADEVEEKAARAEFITAMTAFVTAWGPIVQGQPKMAPLAGALMMFGAHAFKASSALESEIENVVDMMSQQAMMPQAQQAPPDPKIAADKERLDFDRQKHNETLGFEQQKHNDEMGFKEREAIAARDAETQKQQNEITGQVDIAKAGQPKMPPPEEVQIAMGPMFQVMQQMTAQLMQASLQIQAQTSQAVQDSQQRIEQAIEQLVQIAAAPKALTVDRDGKGKIAGGTATPAVKH